MPDNTFESPETRDEQQVQEISAALNALESAESPEDLCAIFKEKQASLLSEEAVQGLDFLAQEIEEDSNDPLLYYLKQMCDLVEYASRVGIQQALDEKALSVYDVLAAEQQFQGLLKNWLEIPYLREERRFLEQHLEIVQKHSLRRLQDIIDEAEDAKAEDAEDAKAEAEERIAFLSHYISILNETLQRRGSSTDVRETYVNRFGGLALDIPSWLEHIEVQLQQLAEQPDRLHERIALFREAITHALRDTDVAPETLASLRHDLGIALKAISPDDPLYAASLEEAIAAQRFVLRTFTFARYPVQYAYAQLELGLCFQDRVEGNRSDNLEQALVCLQAALEIFQHDAFPVEWGEIHFYLGCIYQDRIAGQKGDNIEHALACFRAALEIFESETFPHEWAIIQFRLGTLFVNRVFGEKTDNQQQAIKHFQQTFQVYTRETFPQDWALSHLTLGAFYIDNGSMLDLGADRFSLALEHYQQAEQILKAETFPEEWALIQEGIMAVSANKMDEHKYSILQQAIARGKGALSVLTRVAQPLARAGIHVRLSEVYSMTAAYSDPQERLNILEQALEHVEIALQIYTPENKPDQWAYAQRIQGEIYFDRIRGDRKENLNKARHCCELALRVISREISSQEWVRVQTNLGAVLLAYPEKRKEDIEQAIGCFESSLESCHPIISAVEYARNQVCLCQAYVERIEGDHLQNIETAIKHGQTVFQVFTRQNEPIGWAEAQFYLGIAYVKRTAGERRVNFEQAILCFEYAAEIFTYEYAPLLWAGIQANLCAVYSERSEGENADRDATLAIQYARNALKFYTEENAPQEWALLQFRLGIAYQRLMQNPADDAALQAEKHYLTALRSYTNKNDPLNAALVQLFLGGYYQILALSRSGAAYKQQALSCYHAALQTFTRETTPGPWAMVQLGLGASLGFIHSDSKSATVEREQAVRFLKQAMSILTSEAFPYIHRGILNLNLLIEWKRGRWREVTRLSQAIYEVEADLLRTSTGTSGLDKILAQSLKPSPSAYGAFSMLLQRRMDQIVITPEHGWAQDLARSLVLNMVEPEYIEQAAITLERGRAIELARAMALYQAAPKRITNPERRARYINALDQLKQIRAKLAEMTSLSSRASVTLADRKNFLTCTSACTAAQQTFDEILAEIRHAQDPADFLTETVGRETLQQAVTQVGPGHTLVYLATLEDVGGFALAIQAARKPGNDPLLFEACMLPGLTHDVVDSLVKDGVERNLSSCQEKIVPLLLRPLLRWLQGKLKPSGLTLIPCGSLTGLPLTNLLIDEEKTLGDWLPTSIAPSALSLLHVQPSGEIRDGVHTFGNPRGDLDFAEAEAYALQYIARKLGITTHYTMPKKVTSTALLESLKHALVIDLACHGKVNPDDYLQSCLMLANDPPLTLGTILNWEREMQGLRLLILSACESATADLKGAVDEVRSLTSAMLQAGARAVLAPLWKVDDRATFLLMTRFATEWFPQMQTEPPTVALARAQGWLRTVTNGELEQWEARTLPRSPVPGPQKLRFDMREAEDSIRKEAARNPSDLRPYVDPIYWAGFQIVGW